MSNETEIRPALTDQEWRTARLWHAGKMIGGKVRGMVVLSLPDEQQHGAAALALYGQPFGFTHEHLELLKRLADAVRTEGVTEKDEWLDEELCTGDRALLLAIVKLVKALLPPE